LRDCATGCSLRATASSTRLGWAVLGYVTRKYIGTLGCFSSPRLCGSWLDSTGQGKRVWGYFDIVLANSRRITAPWHQFTLVSVWVFGGFASPYSMVRNRYCCLGSSPASVLPRRGCGSDVSGEFKIELVDPEICRASLRQAIEFERVERGLLQVSSTLTTGLRTPPPI
jgi:hypothetical protein